MAESHDSLPLLSGAGLVVEDNVIIAMEMEMLLRELGCSTCHGAASVHAALEIIATGEITFAVLDLDLGGETSEAVADALTEQGTPYIYITGYDETLQLQQQFPGVPVLVKPFRIDDLVAGIGISHGSTV